jgi:hypothetical protein
MDVVVQLRPDKADNDARTLEICCIQAQLYSLRGRAGARCTLRGYIADTKIHFATPNLAQF